MPIYEYYCENCDLKFELLKSIQENQSGECPECNKLAKRQVSLPGGLIFKGSGFYITDYTKKGSSETAATKKETKGTTVPVKESTPATKPSAADKK